MVGAGRGEVGMSTTLLRSRQLSLLSLEKCYHIAGILVGNYNWWIDRGLGGPANLVSRIFIIPDLVPSPVGTRRNHFRACRKCEQSKVYVRVLLKYFRPS